jgi:sugar lactone lactonase YvrE
MTMTTTSRSTRLLLALLGAVLTAALLATGTLPADAHPRHRYADRIPLPVGFQPEGIAIGRAPVVYTGSRVTGDIYAASLRTGEGRVILPGAGIPSLGMKLDGSRLFVAGGASGQGRVVDVRRRTVLRTFTFTTDPDTFVNDVVLGGRYAWFTDSRQAQLYRVERKGRSTAVTTLALGGAWVQDRTPQVNNANGITLTPDGRALLVVQSNTGFLFRVDPRTGVATRVDLGSTLLTNGDGLLLRGRTLYAVQNRLNQVAVLRLNQAGTRGTLVDTVTSPEFDVPSTVAAYKGSLYLPNARFGDTPADAIDYQITRVTP